ncbi:MAG: GNAT family N-acetyltransferase [Raoultibacter sp.]
MDIPKLIKVKPEQTDLIERLSLMMGKSFLEEPWTEEWLTVLPDNHERKLEIACSIMRYNFILATPYQGCWATPDLHACAGGYLKSNLGNLIWNNLEEESFKMMYEKVLTEEEGRLLREQSAKMEILSNFQWEEDACEGKDFIHFYALGVNADKRGNGAFRRLMEPFFEYADAHGINCYLECYSDRLENLYSHFGFKEIGVFTDSAFPITERCMVREPR